MLADTIALKIGGQWFRAVFPVGLVAAQFASGPAAQVITSRCCTQWAASGSCQGGLRPAQHEVPDSGGEPGHHGPAAIFLDVDSHVEDVGMNPHRKGT